MDDLELKIYSNAIVKISELILDGFTFEQIRSGKNQFVKIPISSFPESGMTCDFALFDKVKGVFTEVEFLKYNPNSKVPDLIKLEFPEWLFLDITP